MAFLRAIVWFLICELAASSGVCAGGVAKSDDVYRLAANETERRSRDVLVTFADEREARVPIGAPTSSYRQRGDYGNSTWSERQAAELAEDYGLVRKTQWPITSLGVHCVVYEVPPPLSVELVLGRLMSDRRVESAQRMQIFHAMSARQQAEPGASDPYHRMQTGSRAMHVDSAHRYATGRGVTVVVIDTGADTNHEDLRGRVTSHESFVPDSAGTAVDVHGTAISGIIAAAAGNGRGIAGIAPDASLRVMKACWQSRAGLPDAECNTFTLALALNTAINARPQIINLSLNGPADSLLERLVVKALSEGIIIVASEASVPMSENSFPAAVPGTIAVRVSAGEDPGPVHASRSLVAPGTDILTTVPGNRYAFMTGSSFAAAHVSGLIALLLELNPALSRGQIVSLLIASKAQNRAESGCAYCVDACGAVAALTGKSDLCAPPVVGQGSTTRVATF